VDARGARRGSLEKRGSVEEPREERQRTALLKVRNLVDKLEHEEHARRRVQRYGIPMLLVAAVILLASYAFTRPRTDSPEEKARKACVVDAWSSLAAAYARQIQKETPEASREDVQQRLEQRQSALQAQAQAQCDAGAKGR
jgi:hypothetical protein